MFRIEIDYGWQRPVLAGTVFDLIAELPELHTFILNEIKRPKQEPLFVGDPDVKKLIVMLDDYSVICKIAFEEERRQYSCLFLEKEEFWRDRKVCWIKLDKDKIADALHRFCTKYKMPSHLTFRYQSAVDENGKVVIPEPLRKKLNGTILELKVEREQIIIKDAKPDYAFTYTVRK